MLLSNLDLLATAPGGVARLRELILTLAVQGKLLSQDPADEPASMLLQKIRAEKARLIAEGRIKWDKPLAEIAEDEKPFELPSSWAWVRLADVVRVLNGRAYRKQELLDAGPIPVLRVGNLFTSNHWYYSDLELDSEKYCEEGDLLYAWSASFGPFIWRGPRAIFHYHIWKLEPWAPHFFDAGYFHKFLAEKTAEIKAAGHGVSMVHMTKEKMEKIVVPYPPLAEQSRIVTRVEELMRLCDALEAKGRLEATQHAQLVSTLLGTLTASTTPEELVENWQRVAQHFDLLLDRPEAIDALEQTLLQLAVRGLLVPQDATDEPATTLLARIRSEKDRLVAEGKIKRDKPLPPITDKEKPFELPVGWVWVPIDALANVGSGTTPSRDNPAYFIGGKTPWVTSGETGQPFIDATEQHITELALQQTSLTVYPPGSLIVAMYGQGKTRGQVAELRISATTNQACAAICLVERSDAHRAYVKLVFEKSYDEIRELSAGGAQPNLNVGKVKSTLIPLPPLAEQSRVVARVTALRGLCSDLRQRLKAAQVTQSHLAQALVESSNSL
ncbi:restriction endonuclease subunit S [Variovorax boronicumulans]|uniref:restriction endonuclease subunit S n=1 Tax=Variovorax boronicumulans TaxID=436515 RepID=UPI0027887641|nr:restriction endonuclease subunit S [Variovorax boronicumulans]MDQ0042323.1 type I restriction enzyme S subunit [Variovorax boronicumulans]